MKRKRKGIDHSGSAFDEFLSEEGTLEEAEAVATKRVVAWQLQQEMQQQRISKKAMANRLRTSRSQLNRLLDPKHSGVALDTLSRAAMVLGKRLKVQVIDGPGRTQRKRPGRVGLGSKSSMVVGKK
jgi:antitoxin HicB